jgi:single-stranded-DNA-specific exonuclease
MRTWSEPHPTTAPSSLVAAVGGRPLVAQFLANRGILKPDSARAFLDPNSYSPSLPEELPGLEEAANRLQKAIYRKETICVWGDFDVDGQTATTLLVSALRDLGANVTYHIPVRASESHGVNLPALQRITNSTPKPQVLLTCDTGISAHESVAYAQQSGVDVLITDHHDLPPSLPQALAVVNPKLLPAAHPLATLPGVGVAYKLVEYLYQHADREPEPTPQLDLVALGIIADLAVLQGDTRYLVQRGLPGLRQPHRLGLQAMFDLAELDPTWLTEEHIAFILAPRLNALGRLSDANPVVEFLTTQDPGRARLFALELEGLNARRKLLSDQIYQAALAQIDQDNSLLDAAALVLAHPAWPAGVLGIVASRLVERFHKPVILLASPPGELARGSARSIEDVNINAAIRAHQQMLAGFGGHPMAAGLSIEPQRIAEFRRLLSQTVQALRGEAPPLPPLQIEAYINLDEINLELVSELEQLAPFGPGNPPPVFASRGLRLLSQTPVGRDGEHLMLTIGDEHGQTQRVIWWQGGREQVPQGKFDLAYTLRSSNYRGQREVQVEWLEARPIEEPVQVIPLWHGPAEILDYRQEADPLPLLSKLRSQPGGQVWCEGEDKKRLDGQNRFELMPAPVLAIWTTPPGPAELHSALQRVKPEKVILFAIDPNLDHMEAFLRRLTGLVKYALRSSQGVVSLPSLAAAMAQRLATVQVGLEWSQAQGHIRILSIDGETVFLEQGAGISQPTTAEIATRLAAMLDETAAFRQYYSHADKEALLQSP